MTLFAQIILNDSILEDLSQHAVAPEMAAG